MNGIESTLIQFRLDFESVKSMMFLRQKLRKVVGETFHSEKKKTNLTT